MANINASWVDANRRISPRSRVVYPSEDHPSQAPPASRAQHSFESSITWSSSNPFDNKPLPPSPLAIPSTPGSTAPGHGHHDSPVSPTSRVPLSPSHVSLHLQNAPADWETLPDGIPIYLTPIMPAPLIVPMPLPVLTPMPLGGEGVSPVDSEQGMIPTSQPASATTSTPVSFSAPATTTATLRHSHSRRTVRKLLRLASGASSSKQHSPTNSPAPSPAVLAPRADDRMAPAAAPSPVTGGSYDKIFQLTGYHLGTELSSQSDNSSLKAASLSKGKSRLASSASAPSGFGLTSVYNCDDDDDDDDDDYDAREDRVGRESTEMTNDDSDEDDRDLYIQYIRETPSRCSTRSADEQDEKTCPSSDERKKSTESENRSETRSEKRMRKKTEKSLNDSKPTQHRTGRMLLSPQLGSSRLMNLKRHSDPSMSPIMEDPDDISTNLPKLPLSARLPRSRSQNRQQKAQATAGVLPAVSERSWSHRRVPSLMRRNTPPPLPPPPPPPPPPQPAPAPVPLEAPPPTTSLPSVPSPKVPSIQLQPSSPITESPPRPLPHIADTIGNSGSGSTSGSSSSSSIAKPSQWSPTPPARPPRPPSLHTNHEKSASESMMNHGAQWTPVGPAIHPAADSKPLPPRHGSVSSIAIGPPRTVPPQHSRSKSSSSAGEISTMTSLSSGSGTSTNTSYTSSSGISLPHPPTTTVPVLHSVFDEDDDDENGQMRDSLRWSKRAFGRGLFRRSSVIEDTQAKESAGDKQKSPLSPSLLPLSSFSTMSATTSTLISAAGQRVAQVRRKAERDGNGSSGSSSANVQLTREQWREDLKSKIRVIPEVKEQEEDTGGVI